MLKSWKVWKEDFVERTIMWMCLSWWSRWSVHFVNDDWGVWGCCAFFHLVNSIAFNVTFVGSLGLFISIFCIFLYPIEFLYMYFGICIKWWRSLAFCECLLVAGHFSQHCLQISWMPLFDLIPFSIFYFFSVLFSSAKCFIICSSISFVWLLWHLILGRDIWCLCFIAVEYAW